MKKIFVKNPNTDIVKEYTVKNESETHYQIGVNEWISKDSKNIVPQSIGINTSSNKQLLHD
jgi:hypothetical protein